MNTVRDPAVKYVTAQRYILDKQMQEIDRKSMSKIYLACGYNCCTARAIMNAPIDLGGAGFVPFCVSALTEVILAIYKRWRTPNEQAGILLCVLYACLAEVLGVTFLLFEKPDIEIPHLRGKVFPAIRNALREIDTALYFDDVYIHPILRQGDMAIMEIAMEIGFSSRQMNQINACQERLGVQYISELASPNGKTIRFNYDTESISEYLPTQTRVKQEMPGKKSWGLFCKAIKSVCDEDMRLKTLLGEWTLNHSRSGKWQYYIEEQSLYKRNGDVWKRYDVNSRQLLAGELNKCFNYETATPIQVHRFGMRLRLETEVHQLIHKTVVDATTFEEYISQQPG